MSEKLQCAISSPLGEIFVVASSKGVHAVSMERQETPMADDLQRVPLLKEATDQLTAYFEGRRTSFDLPLIPEGTQFQKRVWSALLEIPYGQTISYAQLAQKVGSPKAYRAVGSANGKNPFCIVVPCHRVIAADRSLGGYAYGLSVKSQLLSLEGSAKGCLAPD